MKASKSYSLATLLVVITAACSFLAGFSVRQQTTDLAAHATIQNLIEQREIWENERNALLAEIQSLTDQIANARGGD